MEIRITDLAIHNLAIRPVINPNFLLFLGLYTE